jgi:hypothetical protein
MSSSIADSFCGPLVLPAGSSRFRPPSHRAGMTVWRAAAACELDSGLHHPQTAAADLALFSNGRSPSPRWLLDTARHAELGPQSPAERLLRLLPSQGESASTTRSS